MAKRRGRPPGKTYERTVTIALSEDQWERLDLEAVLMDVPFAEAVRMNIEVGMKYTSSREETSDA